MGQMSPSTETVIVLLCCLIVLLALLFFMYKKLNKESYGEYTISRMVYKEGGVRDQVRGAALALETRFGIQLWPRSDSEEDGEEMEDVQDMEEGGSNRDDSDGYIDPVPSRCKENDEESHGRESADYGSSLEEEEHVKMLHKPQPEDQKADKAKEESGGAELIIDLNNFSGSAIWSEEQGDVDMGVTGTAL